MNLYTESNDCFAEEKTEKGGSKWRRQQRWGQGYERKWEGPRCVPARGTEVLPLRAVQGEHGQVAPLA